MSSPKRTIGRFPREFRAATRDMAYACRILVADAMGGTKTLTKIGFGLSRHDREIAIVRAVFGNVDVVKLHHRLEKECAKSMTSTRRNPTGSDLSDMFWTLFLRRVYRGVGGARFDDVIDVSRRLVISGGKVGTRRRMRSDFFTEHDVSPNPLRTVLEGLVTGPEKTFAREWFADARWDDVLEETDSSASRSLESDSLARTKRRSSTTGTTAADTTGSHSFSSYMQHPLDTPLETPIDYIDPERAIAIPITNGEAREGDRLSSFECGFGCGRTWDGNSQCPCS